MERRRSKAAFRRRSSPRVGAGSRTCGEAELTGYSCSTRSTSSTSPASASAERVTRDLRPARRRRYGGAGARIRGPAGRAETAFERIESYPDTPGSSTRWASSLASGTNWGTDAVGAEEDGYPGVLGYQGPALSTAAGWPSPPLLAIEAMMVRKSANEIALLRESARWSARPPPVAGVHDPRRDRGRGGLRAGHEATLAMREELGDASAGSRLVRRRRQPVTAARSACAARGRTRSPTTSSSRPATCS